MAVRVAAAMGFFGVALGAFGAHGLHDILTRHEALATWQTAVFYHLIHAVMLFILARQRPVPTGPWVSFFLGILIFSGSLYVLAVTNAKWLGAITPFGGVSLLAGWVWLMVNGAGRQD